MGGDTVRDSSNDTAFNPQNQWSHIREPIINMNKHILNYILYPDVLMSVDLHSVGRSFYSNLMNIVDFYNLNNFNLDTLGENKINHYFSHMKQEYISFWENAVQHSEKVEFYKIFKPPHYLDHTSKQTERKALVKLRTGNHKLMIKIGRYEQIPHEKRICQVCMATNLPDKIHFLLHGPKYLTLRETFFN